jgi:multiple sugar transport system permease protein
VTLSTVEAETALASGRGAGPGGSAPVRRRRRRFDALPWLLVGPLVLFVALLGIVPAAWTIGLSFFHDNSLDPPVTFNGIQNFIAIFTQSNMLQSIENTGVYTVFGTVLATVLGIAAAWILQQPFRGRGAVIAILILPWALPGIVAGLIWVNIYDANTGLLNSVLSSLHLIGGYQVWIGQNPTLTIVLIELVQVWQMVPLAALLILASMQNIPSEIYEAARLDGCSDWQAFRRLTLPLSRPGIAVAAVQSLIQTLNVFDQPYALNGQATTGSSITMQTYFVSFQNLDFGQGYALSLIVSLITVILSWAVLKLVYREVSF